MSELDALEAAFAAATDGTDSEASPATDPFEAAGEQASTELFDEQAITEESLDDIEEAEAEELFDAEDVGYVDGEQTTGITEADLSGLTFQLPGVEEPVSFQEMRDGYMRQADSTRKWQAVADERKANEKAWKLYEAIQADPLAVARQIAEETGLLAPGAAPANAVDFSVFNTAEAVEAEISKRVSEQLASHPSVIQAEEVAAQRWVDTEFEKIQEIHGVKLGPNSRMAVLQEANKRGIADLDMVFASMHSAKQRRSEETARLKGAAPARPKGSKAKGHVDEVAEVSSIESAFELAFAGVDA